MSPLYMEQTAQIRQRFVKTRHPAEQAQTAQDLGTMLRLFDSQREEAKAYASALEEANEVITKVEAELSFIVQLIFKAVMAYKDSPEDLAPVMQELVGLADSHPDLRARLEQSVQTAQVCAPLVDTAMEMLGEDSPLQDIDDEALQQKLMDFAMHVMNVLSPPPLFLRPPAAPVEQIAESADSPDPARV